MDLPTLSFLFIVLVHFSSAETYTFAKISTRDAYEIANKSVAVSSLVACKERCLGSNACKAIAFATNECAMLGKKKIGMNCSAEHVLFIKIKINSIGCPVDEKGTMVFFTINTTVIVVELYCDLAEGAVKYLKDFFKKTVKVLPPKYDNGFVTTVAEVSQEPESFVGLLAHEPDQEMHRLAFASGQFFLTRAIDSAPICIGRAINGTEFLDSIDDDTMTKRGNYGFYRP